MRGEADMTDQQAPAPRAHPVRDAIRPASYQLPAPERTSIAEEVAERLDLPMAALGVVAFLLVIAEGLAEPRGALSDAFLAITILLFLVFAAEFVLRLAVAPSTSEFMRRNWWQVIFLVLPMLRAVRAVARVARAGRLASSAIRATRSAGSALSSRLSWLVMTTSILILTAAQLLHDLAGFDYGRGLHAAALATINGEPIGSEHPLAQALDVVLGIYAVVVVAAAAGAAGAYFLEQRGTAVRADGSRRG